MISATCTTGSEDPSATTDHEPRPRSENIAGLGSQADTFGGVGARQQAELTELADWAEGLRAGAHTARDEGNIQLAEALDITRFEVYEAYLDKELHREPSIR